MLKSTATTVSYTVYNTTDGSVVTSDAANHTCRISKDGGAFATCSNSPTELGYGVYKLTLSASETNCATAVLCVVSSTSNTHIPPVLLSFDDAATYRADVSSLATATALSTVSGKIDTLDTVLDGVAARMPNSGTLSTLTALDLPTPPTAAQNASAVWTAAARTLTSSPTDLSGVESTLAALTSTADTIQERTDHLPDHPAAVGDAMTLTSAYDSAKNFTIDTTAIADAVLGRDITTVQTTAGTHSLCTIILAHLSSSMNEGVWTIFRTNGTTQHATFTLVSDESATPITGVSA